MSQEATSERRTVFRDAASGAGDVGPERMQLYLDGDKLMAQKYGGTAVLVADLTSGSATPAGTVNAYAGVNTSVPAGWLLCNGQEVSQATYATLFGVIADTYDPGDTAASGNFLLPDLRGKVVAAEDATYARGAAHGAASVSLAAANVPLHDHGLSSATITSTVSDNSTIEDYGTPWSHDATDTYVNEDDPDSGDETWRMAEIWSGGLWGVQPEDPTYGLGYAGGDAPRPYLNMRADKDWNHYFDVASEFAANVTTDNSTGNGNSGVDGVDVRQPTLYMNYIIKT